MCENLEKVKLGKGLHFKRCSDLSLAHVKWQQQRKTGVLLDSNAHHITEGY